MVKALLWTSFGAIFRLSLDRLSRKCSNSVNRLFVLCYIHLVKISIWKLLLKKSIECIKINKIGTPWEHRNVEITSGRFRKSLSHLSKILAKLFFLLLLYCYICYISILIYLYSYERVAYRFSYPMRHNDANEMIPHPQPFASFPEFWKNW